jgi:hypothetical protein
MAHIINRFRHRKPAQRSSSPSTEQVYLEDKNVSLPSEPGVQPLESKARDSDDPELATDPNDTNGESAVEEDLRDIPVEVRNTVSFEDDPNLPTITFRYFLLTFLFVAPGAFLYQMVWYLLTQ